MTLLDNPRSGADTWASPRPRPGCWPRCSPPARRPRPPTPGTRPPSERGVQGATQAEARAAIENGEIPGVDEIVHADNIQHLTNIPKDALPGTNSDLAFQGKYAFAGNYDGFRIFDISNPKAPEDRQPGALPRLAERHLRLRRPALPVHRLLAQRQLLHQHHAARDREVLLGGHEDLRHQRQARTRSTSPPSRPPAARTPTRWCPSARTSTSTSPRTRRAPPSPTASRRTTASRSSRCRARRPRRPRSWTSRCSSREADGGGNPGAPTNPGVSKTTGCHDITASPKRTWRPAPAWATASCSTSRTRRSPKVIDRVAGQRQLRLLALGDLQPDAATRSSSPTSWAAAARRPATRRSVRTAAPTASTTSSARATSASSSSGATSRSRATRPTPRTASPTTAR